MDCKEIFQDYEVKCSYGHRRHPGHVVETASLASVSMPIFNSEHSLPAEILGGRNNRSKGSLSGVQMDAVLMVDTAHQLSLTGRNQIRQAALLGDGTGMGKGRTIAAIIINNWFNGRQKALWISHSPVLIEDAKRDLSDLLLPLKPCQPAVKIHSLPANYEKISHKDGILFCTYASLCCISKTASGSGFVSRKDQILDWLGGDDFKGVVIFDEAHKAKGYKEDDSSSSKTGNVVVDLQKAIPKARIVYVSATIAASINDMEFMTRLGLWGTKYTTFKDAQAFFRFVKLHGIAGYEIAACEMKSRGMYLSRHLSFSECTFRLEEFKSTPEMCQLYDKCAQLWKWIIIECPPSSSSQLWATCQKFFRALCISAKLPYLLEEIRKGREQGKSIVVGIQSTGEAPFIEFKSSNYHNAQDLFSPCRTYLENFLLNMKGFKYSAVELGLHFKRSLDARVETTVVGGSTRKSIKRTLDDIESDFESSSDESSVELSKDKSDGSGSSSSSSSSSSTSSCSSSSSSSRSSSSSGSIEEDSSGDESGVPAKINLEAGTEKSRAKSTREIICSLFREVSPMLPLNPIDVISAEFGYENVSEMTGRLQFQIIKKNSDGSFTAGKLVNRSKAKFSPLQCAHLSFQTGQTRIVVISDAASTGISLHSSAECLNQDKRMHIVLESPWSAISLLQQMGRTNRSNQTKGPEYLIVMSDVPAESRFASSIAERMGNLGALCQGDRNSSYGSLWSKYESNPWLAKKGIRMLLEAVIGKAPENNRSLFVDEDDEKERESLQETFLNVGALYFTKAGKILPKQAVISQEKFMNRVLCLPIAQQERVLKLLRAAIENTEITDEPTTEITDLDKVIDAPFVEQGRTAFRLNSKVTTFLVTFVVNNILTWDQLQVNLDSINSKRIIFYQKDFLKSRKKVCVFVEPKSSLEDYAVFRPSSKESVMKSRRHLIRRGYKEISVEDAKTEWLKMQSVFMLGMCSGYIKTGEACETICNHKQPGVKFAVVNGGIFSVWDDVAACLPTTRFVRHQNIFGIYIPGKCYDKTIRVLNLLATSKK